MSYDKFYKLTEFDKEYIYGYILLKLKKEKQGVQIIKKEITNYTSQIEENPNCSNKNEKKLADMFAILDDKTESLKWLNKAVKKGWLEYRSNLVYPFLDSLKNTMQFNFLIGKMKAKIDSIKILLKKSDVSFEECN